MIPVLSVLAADLEHQHHQSTCRWGQPAGWTVLSHCRTISHPTRPSCVHATTPNPFSSQSPLAKNLFWRLFYSPSQYISEASALQLKTASLPKPLKLFGFVTTDGFDFAADCFSYCFGLYFCWKNKLCIVHYKCFPFCFMWLAEVVH